MIKTYKSRVKYNKARHSKKKIETTKSITNDNSKEHKHSYYTIECHYKNKGIIFYYLEKYLEKLGIVPDKSIDIILKKDMKFFKSIHKPFDTYCDNFKELPKFNKDIVKADVFLVQSYNPVVKKRFYNYKKYFANILNYENIVKFSNKNDIVKEFKKISVRFYKQYIAKTFHISEINKFKFPKWYIIRPIYGALGKDVFYINNADELDSILYYYKINKNYKKKLYSNNVIASEYITNPLLFNEKKFHLRAYFIVSLTNNILNTFLIKFGGIMIAKNKFNMDVPFDNETHTSSGRYTKNDYYFPFDFNTKNLGIDIDDSKIDIIWKHITNMCRILARIFENNKDTLLLPNQENGYGLFAIDIIIRDNMVPVFIELNETPMIAANTMEKLDIVSRIIYKWINDTVLEPLFKYNDPMIARKHPTYINPF